MSMPSNNLVEMVYNDVRSKLQRSVIPPSEGLVDTDIAQYQGLPRMPAREALLRLVAEGNLVGTTRGSAVRELSLEDISGLFEVRRQLEPRAAASAARDLTETGEANLKDAMRRIEQVYAAGNMSALLEANVDFRNAWLGLVSNSHMAQTIYRFMDYFQSIRLGTLSDSDLAESYSDGPETSACRLFGARPTDGA